MKQVVLVCLMLVAAGAAFAEPSIAVEAKGAVLTSGAFHISVSASEMSEGASTNAEVFLDGKSVHAFEISTDEQVLAIESPGLSAGKHTISVKTDWAEGSTDIKAIPGWLSILPPLIAIGLALISKDVLISLFLGVFSGALILYNWNPITAFARSIDSIIVPALADADHAKIIIFSILLGGMVGIISKSGGTHGIVERLRGFATNARRGQIATWMMGILVFFDDYANTLIVGSTMRPITDRLRISREKLAYIVDSTAAPIASIIPISTWVGFEVGLINGSFAELGLGFNPYTTFIDSIAYRFYPIFALILGFTIAFSRRDFGPMLKAELRASDTGQVVAEGDVPLADYSTSALAPPPDIPHRAINAIVPILVVIGVTIVGLYVNGSETLNRADYGTTTEWFREVFSNANSLDVLCWASLSSVVVALILPLAQRILTVRQAAEGMVEGYKAMLLALFVLVLAWSIGAITGELHTADYIVGITSGVLSPRWLPVLVFIVSAAISFATGTSWGTMGILMPLTIPISHQLALGSGLDPASDAYYLVLVGAISSVLAGSVWGDHCSPISDTTILSSMGSGCDHIAHVRTQLPYAFSIGILGMIVGDIPAAYGLSPVFSILIGSAVIIGAVMLIGKRSDWQGEEEAA